MIINGVELEIDFTDAEIVEKILKDFLDYVLGDGTSRKLFGEKNSLQQCVKAFEDIINARKQQYDEFQARVSKYSPDRLKR